MAGRVRKAVEAVEGLCAEHFPHGFPAWAEAVGADTVYCEHGPQRKTPEPQQEDAADTETPPES